MCEYVRVCVRACVRAAHTRTRVRVSCVCLCIYVWVCTGICICKCVCVHMCTDMCKGCQTKLKGKSTNYHCFTFMYHNACHWRSFQMAMNLLLLCCIKCSREFCRPSDLSQRDRSDPLPHLKSVPALKERPVHTYIQRHALVALCALTRQAADLPGGAELSRRAKSPCRRRPPPWQPAQPALLP